MNDLKPTGSTCERCGVLLAAGTLGGLCPRCLLTLNLAPQTNITGDETGPAGTQVVKPPPEAPAPPAEIAKHFPQLEILKCLGRGGMGVVYQARQTRLNRLVALKILAPEKNQDPAFAERFLREAQALARLNHPNIVTIYDFGEADGLYFLLMEFMDGVSLRQLIHTRQIPPEQALAIVPKVCEALQYAHEQGIVHRDIKPENILLDQHGRVKIADFGIAKLLGREGGSSVRTEENQVVGTPHYMAPEQVESPQKVDHRADIFSLGVVFYEMLTGALPLGNFAPPSAKVAMDVRLDEVVLRALEKEPERRYQHASQVKTDVETIAHTIPPPPTAPRPPISTSSGQIPGVQGPAASHFSTLAIIGASWAPFAFIAFFMFIMTVHVQVIDASQPPGTAWWQILLSITLLPLGLTAPFGTTILGGIAVTQIRRSAGRLYGLGLALGDALLFPLLALDGLIYAFWLHLLHFVMHSDAVLPAEWLVFALTLVCSVVVDFLIARWAWSQVNKPAGSASLTAQILA